MTTPGSSKRDGGSRVSQLIAEKEEKRKQSTTGGDNGRKQSNVPPKKPSVETKDVDGVETEQRMSELSYQHAYRSRNSGGGMDEVRSMENPLRSTKKTGPVDISSPPHNTVDSNPPKKSINNNPHFVQNQQMVLQQMLKNRPSSLPHTQQRQTKPSNTNDS